MKANTKAVKIEDREVVLEVTFKLRGPGVEESDIERFTELFGGTTGRSAKQAAAAVVATAKVVFAGWRNDHPTWEIGAWDAEGNQY